MLFERLLLLLLLLILLRADKNLSFCKKRGNNAVLYMSEMLLHIKVHYSEFFYFHYQSPQIAQLLLM